MDLSSQSEKWWEVVGKQKDEFKLNVLQGVGFAMPGSIGDNIYLRLLGTKQGTSVVLTDGLRAYERGPGEFFVETKESIEALSGAWPTALILELCKLIPKGPTDITDKLERYSTLSLSVEITGAPHDWSLDYPRGNIGLFLNLPHDYSVANTRLINVKLMRPAELKYAIEESDKGGREHLQELYEIQGDTILSSLGRGSVIN